METDDTSRIEDTERVSPADSETKADAMPDVEQKQTDVTPSESQTPAVGEPTIADQLKSMFDSLGSDLATKVGDGIVEQMKTATKAREDAANAREEIVNAAKPALGPNYAFAEKSDSEVMRDAIVARNPDYKARADAAEGDALRGSFDAIMAMPAAKKEHPLGNFDSKPPSSVDPWIARYDAIRKAFLYERIGGVELCRRVDAGKIQIGATN